MLLAFQATWSLILECCRWNAWHGFFSILSVNLPYLSLSIYWDSALWPTRLRQCKDHFQPVNWGSGSLVLRCLNELLQRALLPVNPQIWCLLPCSELWINDNQWVSMVNCRWDISQVGRRWTAIKKLEAFGPLAILQFQSWGCPSLRYVLIFGCTIFLHFPPEASSINATVSCWLPADLCPASFVTVSALVTLQACRQKAVHCTGRKFSSGNVAKESIVPSASSSMWSFPWCGLAMHWFVPFVLALAISRGPSLSWNLPLMYQVTPSVLWSFQPLVTISTNKAGPELVPSLGYVSCRFWNSWGQVVRVEFAEGSKDLGDGNRMEVWDGRCVNHH